MLAPSPAPSIAELEAQYIEAYAIADAVIVPAARSAMLLLIRAAVAPGGLVIGPSFTCMAVHEAMLGSPARTRFIEPAPGGYAMSAADVRAAAAPGCGIVLSELYGIRYDADFLAALEDLQPALRIIDSAMGIPDVTRLRALKPTDVALFSFGMGKSLCAGGGGIALFADRALAARVRAMRDEMLGATSFSEQLRNDLKLVAGMILRARVVAAHAAALRARTGRVPAPPVTTSAAPGTGPNDTGAPANTYLSPEWTHHLTRAQRRLVAHVLRGAQGSAALRREQANLYLRSLADIGVTPGVGAESLPQSHFPIRVPSNLREALREKLRAHGFDTGDEFPISAALRSNDYPRALATSLQVLTLPMGEGVSQRAIEALCGRIVDALRHTPMKVGSGSAQTDL
jgi:dTDP-4-amino-4,6-dideoxygalactose transaminase